jgi:DNA-binding CsgD family transcriptional regulator
LIESYLELTTMRALATEASISTSPGTAERDDWAHKLVLVQPRRTDRGSASEAIRVEVDIVVVGAAADGEEALAVTDGEAVAAGGAAREVVADSADKYVRAVLSNGLGRYDDALAAARLATQYPENLTLFTRGLVELIEAAARSGKKELAADALVQLSQTTTINGSDWALGLEARSRALLSEGETAETLYRQAIERLARTRVRTELARAHLLYGEWLRRERRRLEARDQLRHAHELFSHFGIQGFAERARVELEATGEHARKRTVQTRDDLTPREAQISRLAAEGATNHEIAGQLFISASTVDYHLRKAFRKLGVKSRYQLEQQLLEPGGHADTAPRGTDRDQPLLAPVPVEGVARIALWASVVVYASAMTATPDPLAVDLDDGSPDERGFAAGSRSTGVGKRRRAVGSLRAGSGLSTIAGALGVDEHDQTERRDPRNHQRRAIKAAKEPTRRPVRGALG